MKKSLQILIVLSLFLSTNITVFAAPKVMDDGTVFDADYYANQYPDVVAVYGTEESALYEHYIVYGRNEGRTIVADEELESEMEVATNKSEVYSSVSDEFLNNAVSIHNYYKGISSDKASQADAVAKQIADTIMSNSNYVSDRQRVNAAAKIVASYCDNAMYETDEGRVYYRSPAGVFIEGIYTCAGATRALGRVLDYMGYSWEHAHENEYGHQWCNVTMDGYFGYADGMGGFADYGDRENEGISLASMFAASFR